ncbi:helix-turn-helix transcriptional regulator [Actinoplanes sp. NPDC051859]|uniref:helix-turn-helix transcriptional regulator n=1 Tax=Actinoplanes sp. NPDC051859 TaxID=3363909 RepID=UPI003796E5DE
MGTASARSLGSALHQLRVGAGDERSPQWTLEEVAKAIEVHKTTVSRVERGTVAVNPRIVDKLLDFYGVEDRLMVASIRQLAEAGRRRKWWTDYRDVLHPKFQHVLGLEAEAVSLHAWEPSLVPGLLQTAEYARALVVAYQRGRDAAGIERTVKARMERQAILQREDAPLLQAVIGEAALHRVIGSREVMYAQLRQLAEATGQPNVQVQVLPFSAGAIMSEVGGLQVLRFADSAAGEVVCAEALTRSLYVDDREEVGLYRDAWEDVLAHAATRQESAEMIEAAAEEMK